MAVKSTGRRFFMPKCDICKSSIDVELSEFPENGTHYCRACCDWFTPDVPHKPSLGTNPKDLLGTDKVPLSRIPPVAIAHIGMAMGDGGDKYGPYNWRGNSVIASIYIDAAMRHLLAWFDGEEAAEDSGVHHLGHAAACMAILLDAQATGNLSDDRPKGGRMGEVLKGLNAVRKERRKRG